jgi:hypothetical protein
METTGMALLFSIDSSNNADKCHLKQPVNAQGYGITLEQKTTYPPLIRPILYGFHVAKTPACGFYVDLTITG